MVVIVLPQWIGTGRGQAEFPMQVQGVHPKAVYQDRHASGRAMVAAAAAYMALIAPSPTNTGRQITNPCFPTGVLHTPPWPRLQVIEVPPPSRLCYSFLSGR